VVTVKRMAYDRWLRVKLYKHRLAAFSPKPGCCRIHHRFRKVWVSPGIFECAHCVQDLFDEELRLRILWESENGRRREPVTGRGR
jgi:hypothetical protein